MNAIADALVDAVMFIAIRDYGDNENAEDFEGEDIRALENLTGILSDATDEERMALTAAVERALSKLPPGSEVAPFYRAWMTNMFGDPESDEED